MILANCRSRGVTLIFSYIRRLWLFWGVQNFGVFRKMNIFWVLRFCEYFFFWGGGVITILDFIKGPFLCILGSFLRSMYRMGNIFLVAKI